MDKEEVKKTEKQTCFQLKDSCLTFLSSLFFPAIGALAVVLLFMFVSMAFGIDYNRLMESKFVTVVTICITPAVFFGIYFIYTKKYNFNRMKASEISFKVNWIKIVIAITMAVVSVFLISPFISLTNYLFSLIGYKMDNNLPYVMNNGWRFSLGLIIFAFLPALAEELLFRGIVFKGLQNKFKPHLAIFISAILFTLLHGSLQQTVYQFIIGMLLGYVMYYGKNILYSITLHFFNNMFVVISSFIYTLKGIDSNIVKPYKTPMDFITPILLLILGVAILVGLIFLMKYFDNIEQKKVKAVETNSNENDEKVSETVVEAKVENLTETSNETKTEPITETLEEVEKTEEIDQTQVLENVEEKPTNKITFTKEEKILMWTSMGVGLVLWIFNTVMQFLSV